MIVSCQSLAGILVAITRCFTNKSIMTRFRLLNQSMMHDVANRSLNEIHRIPLKNAFICR
ncbi:hypothetical protein CLV58_105243 [Spirosoma oryzae]|uniref:Uncharacterized protein n=1 Tax=Spirosoma oryzae TaxID=1469603 RepID=A0A2T0T8R8_9BACT|nr:hypothetical protein CLV58_105243 [Spirosoma oryzae]